MADLTVPDGGVGAPVTTEFPGGLVVRAHDDRRSGAAPVSTAVSTSSSMPSPAAVAAARRLTPGALDNPTLSRLVEVAARLLGTGSARVSLLSDVVAAHGEPAGTADGGAYLGVPLVSDAGVAVGTLCVSDPAPRTWTDHDVALLEQLAVSTRAELELAALTREYDTDRARWELAVEASDVGTFDWDLRTGDLAWDDRLIALYGYDAGDAHFDRSIASVEARVHPDDRDLVTQSMADAIAAVGPIEVTYRIVVPPGRTRWLEARGRAIPDPADPAGPAVRLLGVSWDVTAAQEGEARADRVLASMPLGYLAMDRDWRVTAINDEGARLAAARPRSMLGRDFWELHPALVGSAFDTVYRAVASSGVSQTIEAFYPEPLNAWYEVRVTANDGGVALYFLDVTDRRETQARAELAAEHDRTVAQTLQTVLLPEPSPVAGFDIAGRYLTAAAADQVGGDWYDTVLQPDGALVAMVGDVVGHDIRAAATMGQLRSMLRMAAWTSLDSPAQLVRQLDLAGRDLHVNALATLAVCRIGPASTGSAERLLTWTSAGHPPPVVVDREGNTRVLAGERADLLLGVRPDVNRHDHETMLGAGSTVVLYTDGLVETRTNDVDAGTARLQQALTRHHTLPPADLAAVLLGELIDGPPGDDTAVLVIRLDSSPRASSR